MPLLITTDMCIANYRHILRIERKTFFATTKILDGAFQNNWAKYDKRERESFPKQSALMYNALRCKGW